jgi:hypothetical protein
LGKLACSKWNATSYTERIGDWRSYEIVQGCAHLAPEHLAEFAGNEKIAKSVAGKSGVVVNVA